MQTPSGADDAASPEGADAVLVAEVARFICPKLEMIGLS
jgi:hypothetical protein